jgi:hypothetical protein
MTTWMYYHQSIDFMAIEIVPDCTFYHSVVPLTMDIHRMLSHFLIGAQLAKTKRLYKPEPLATFINRPDSSVGRARH